MKRAKLTIDIGDIDVFDLKIVGDGMIGTLHIERANLSFSPPNSKKEPKNRITWDKLPSVINAFGNVNGSK